MNFAVKGLLAFALAEAARKRKIQVGVTSQPYLLSPRSPCSIESHASDGGGGADAEAQMVAAVAVKKEEGRRRQTPDVAQWGGVAGGVLGLWYAVVAVATRQREQRTSQPALHQSPLADSACGSGQAAIGIACGGEADVVQWGAVAGGEEVAALVAAGDSAALVELLRCGDAARKTAATRALKSLTSNDDANQVVIMEAGAVAPLVELLSCGDAAGKKAAAWALNNLAGNDANKVAIVNAGAVAPLVELLRCGDAARKTAAAGTLQHMASNNDDNQVAIAEAGAVAPLVAAGGAAVAGIAAVFILFKLFDQPGRHGRKGACL